MSMGWDTRTPCGSCPYRRDAPLGQWHRSEFELLKRNDADPMAGAVYGCHVFRLRRTEAHVCAGWLLDQKRRGFPSIQLRIALAVNERARVALAEVSAGGHRLFRSIAAMCRANGVK